MVTTERPRSVTISSSEQSYIAQYRVLGDERIESYHPAGNSHWVTKLAMGVGVLDRARTINLVNCLSQGRVDAAGVGDLVGSHRNNGRGVERTGERFRRYGLRPTVKDRIGCRVRCFNSKALPGSWGPPVRLDGEPFLHRFRNIDPAAWGLILRSAATGRSSLETGCSAFCLKAAVPKQFILTIRSSPKYCLQASLKRLLYRTQA